MKLPNKVDSSSFSRIATLYWHYTLCFFTDVMPKSTCRFLVQRELKTLQQSKALSQSYNMISPWRISLFFRDFAKDCHLPFTSPTSEPLKWVGAKGTHKAMEKKKWNFKKWCNKRNPSKSNMRQKESQTLGLFNFLF